MIRALNASQTNQDSVESGGTSPKTVQRGGKKESDREKSEREYAA